MGNVLYAAVPLCALCPIVASAFVPPSLLPDAMVRALLSTPQATSSLARPGPSVSVDHVEPNVATQQSDLYDWRHGWQIHYERAGASGPPVLFIPGFGVGTFHYRRNVGELARSHRVFVMDLLGQGKSWPTREPEPEHGLAFSVDLWLEQIHTFIRDVIKEPVYLAGNSLGGFLSVGIAAEHPELVKGLVLLNATPFWAWRPHASKIAPWLEKLVPWDGTPPAPQPLDKFGASYFDKLRDRRLIRSMLEVVYANKQAFDNELVEAIRAPTENPLGHAVFTSILFAAKSERSFDEWVERVSCPTLLLYGKQDPWVTPHWAQKMLRSRPDALYYELSPAGHSPHHETPHTVNTLMSDWIGSLDDENLGVPFTSQRRRTFLEDVTGSTVTAELQDGSPRDLVEWLVAKTLLR